MAVIEKLPKVVDAVCGFLVSKIHILIAELGKAVDEQPIESASCGFECMGVCLEIVGLIQVEKVQFRRITGPWPPISSTREEQTVGVGVVSLDRRVLREGHQRYVKNHQRYWDYA